MHDLKKWKSLKIISIATVLSVHTYFEHNIYAYPRRVWRYQMSISKSVLVSIHVLACLLLFTIQIVAFWQLEVLWASFTLKGKRTRHILMYKWLQTVSSVDSNPSGEPCLTSGCSLRSYLPSVCSVLFVYSLWYYLLELKK